MSTPKLSPRELQVLSAVARGLKRSAISQEFGIGLGTVNYHLQNAFAKLGVHTAAAAVSKVKVWR